MTEKTVETPDPKAARQAALNAAYAEASNTLRSNHQDEFNALYKAAAAARGETWNPRLTKKQKAEQELARLLAEFPDLKDNLGPAQTDPWATPDGPVQPA